MIMSGMNRRKDVWCEGKDGKRKVVKWDYGLEMVELIVKWIKMVRELILMDLKMVDLTVVIFRY